MAEIDYENMTLTKGDQTKSIQDFKEFYTNHYAMNLSKYRVGLIYKRGKRIMTYDWDSIIRDSIMDGTINQFFN